MMFIDSPGGPTIIDDVGGAHEGGCGWNPQGVFCGECSSLSCDGCPEQFTPDVPRGVAQC